MHLDDLLINVNDDYYWKFGIKNEVCISYSSFTGTFKIISLHYGIGEKSFVMYFNHSQKFRICLCCIHHREAIKYF